MTSGGAARALGTSRATIHRKINHCGIAQPLRFSDQKRWLTIIIAKRGIPHHLLPHAAGSESG
jgi:hypothetical protein